jgi:hypothetical protein
MVRKLIHPLNEMSREMTSLAVNVFAPVLRKRDKDNTPIARILLSLDEA